MVRNFARKPRRESGTKERERKSRGEAIREEKGAKYRAPIIKPRLFVCEPPIATPVPRHAVRNYREFSRFERARVDGETRQTVFSRGRATAR